MKVKVRVKIQDEEEQYHDIAKAEKYNKDEVIKNQDEIIEFLSNEIGALKMQLSALKKEYDMLQKQYDSLKKTYEETKEKDAKYAFEMGQNFGQKAIDYNALKSEYDYLKAENERLHKSEENNIGMQASMKDLCSRYHKLSSDYDSIRTNYRNYLNTIIEACKEKLEELNKNGGSKNG